MRLVKAQATLWGETPTDPREALRRIERCGRICYKSEDKITDQSAPKFIRGIIDRGHFSVLEHSNIVMRMHHFPFGAEGAVYGVFQERMRYHNLKVSNGTLYMNGNLRAWLETIQWLMARGSRSGHDLARALKALLFSHSLKETHPEFKDNDAPLSPFEIVTDSNEIPIELKMYTAHFVTNRAITHELVRHRPCAFSQESTRYVDYGDGEISFIIPPQHDIAEGVYRGVTPAAGDDVEYEWMSACMESERDYKKLRSLGQRPEQARGALNNDTKTEIVVTADRAEWYHIVKLRDHPAAHFQIREIIHPIAVELNL